MEVLLREPVVKLGKRGDVVRVASGYARNFLFPKRLAVPVSDGNKKQLEVERRNYERRAMAETAVAEEAKEKLAELSLTIEKRSGESGILFGSVTTQEIAALLAENGFDIDRRKISVPHIKELGEHDVQIRLHTDVSAEIKLNVVPRT